MEVSMKEDFEYTGADGRTASLKIAKPELDITRLASLIIANPQAALILFGCATMDEVAKSMGYKSFADMEKKTGPDPNQKDAHGKSAFDYAAERPKGHT